jgi:two-component system, OmpR family, sensor histidine kinase QseC
MMGMAGRSKTLRQYLLVWVLAVISLVWLAQLLATWHIARHEAQEITDGQLIAVARLWLSTTPEQVAPSHAIIVPERIRDYVQDVAVLRWVDGHLVTDTHGLLGAGTQSLRIGFQNLRLPASASVQGPTQTWRVYMTEQPSHHGLERVAVMMHLDHRDELAWDVSGPMALPLLLLFPVAMALLWWAIRAGIKPLQRMTEDITALQGKPDERLHTAAPFAEFQSTVRAVDQLLLRLNAQRAHERAFASDLAHELRTPLTAMALQANALTVAYSPEFAQALQTEALKAGEILRQLLILARAQSGSPAVRQELSLQTVTAQLWPAMTELAARKAQTLTLHANDQADDAIWAEPVAVELILRNVLDNALRHTPAQSHVVLRLLSDDQAVHMEVEDWPSVHPTDAGSQPKGQDAVGLGLGLQLVERLVQSQGAQWQIIAKPEGGRRVRVTWLRS